MSVIAYDMLAPGHALARDRGADLWVDCFVIAVLERLCILFCIMGLRAKIRLVRAGLSPW